MSRVIAEVAVEAVEVVGISESFAVGRIADHHSRSVGEILAVEVSLADIDHARETRCRNVVSGLFRNASVLFDANHRWEGEIASASVASPFAFLVPELSAEVGPSLQGKASFQPRGLLQCGQHCFDQQGSGAAAGINEWDGSIPLR